MAVPVTFLSSTPHVPAHTHTHLDQDTLTALRCSSGVRAVPAARMYCAPFPGNSSRLLTSVPTGRAPSGCESPSLARTAMRPIAPDVRIRSPASMFSVAMIQRLRLPPATRAISADLTEEKTLVRSGASGQETTRTITDLQGSYLTSMTFSSMGCSSLPAS